MALVGDGFDAVDKGAPGFFGGLQMVALFQFLFGVPHQHGAVAGVGAFRFGGAVGHSVSSQRVGGGFLKETGGQSSRHPPVVPN